MPPALAISLMHISLTFLGTITVCGASNATEAQYAEVLTELQTLKQRLDTQDAVIAELNATLTTYIQQSDLVVVFQAYRNSVFIGSGADDSIIPFDVVHLNIGSAYNSNSGIFIAPVDGYYLFSHHIFPDNTCGTKSYHVVRTKMVKNGDVISSKTSVSPNSATNVEALQLALGDTVWISIHKTSSCRSISDGMYNGFSGFLVKEIKTSSGSTCI